MAWCCLELVDKRGFAVSLVVTFAVDLLVCFIVFLIGSFDSKEASDKDRYAGSTADTINCCLVRVIFFPLISYVAYRVYHRKAAESPINQLREADRRERQAEQRAGELPDLADVEGGLSQLAAPLTGGLGLSDSPTNGATNGATSGKTNGTTNGHTDEQNPKEVGGAGALSDAPSVPSNLTNGTTNGATNGHAVDPETAKLAEAAAAAAKKEREAAAETEAKKLHQRKEQHTLTMKVADKQRNFTLSGLFALCTGMSMYNGLKCVEFHYDPSIIALQATLLALVIFLINIEFFLLRDFLNKLTEEEGELIPDMHMHPLFFETGLKCHVCDICHESMKKPHYVAYRCRTCDFDLCPRCYKQKDKPSAKGFGGRAIRRDGEQLTTWTFFVRILTLSLEFKYSMAAAIGSLIVTQGLSLWAPRLQGNIFDTLIKGLNDPSFDSRSAFADIMFFYLALNVLQGAFGGLKSLFQELVMRKLACAVRSQLFASVIRMDIAFFDGMHTGQLTSRLTNDASQMVQPLSTLMNDMLANLISLGGGAVMAFATSWKLSILALTVVPPITFSYRLYAQWGRKVNRSIYCAYGEGNSTATEAIHNIRTVRAFSTERHEMEKYDDSINTALSHGVKNAYVSGSVNAFASYMTSGTAVLILWFGGLLVVDTEGKQMTVGSLITFQLYWNMMNTGFIALSNVFNDLIRASSAAERVCSLIDARPEVDPDDGEEVTREGVKGNLELIGVQFRYRTRPEHIVLKGVDITMSPCTTTALVGKSGGGKSTLVHLLMRFYEPTEGTIRLDGKDMAKLSSHSVRKCCGFVAQDTQLFASSISENLAYGLGRVPDHREVVAACEKANAHDFIMETEEKYETRVGEKGILLSGGQRQRLAIARCFLRAPRLLFLDEATSALDSENEGIVQASLEKLISELQCTVVLIAHRLSTVINATQIAVIQKGEIIELGPHKELVDRDGVYAMLVKGQLIRDASTAKAAKEGEKAKAATIDDIFEDMEKKKSAGPADNQTTGPEEKGPADVRAELESMAKATLRSRAAAAGVAEAALLEAIDAEDTKAALVELILAKEAGSEQPGPADTNPSLRSCSSSEGIRPAASK